MHVQSYGFVYWTYIKKTREWGPVYIEKKFPGVTLPARVNLSKRLYENQLTLLPWLKTALSHPLARFNRVEPAGQAKCLLGEKLT